MTAHKALNAKIHSILDEFLLEQNLPLEYKEVALRWFIPLAIKIIEHQISAKKTIVVGVNGCQGSGKSTLTNLLLCLLNKALDTPSIGFSIDDFYLSKQARQALALNIHPLFATRGVPGTHDISLLEDVLKKLVDGEQCSIPSFDKSIDDVKSIGDWQQTTVKPKVIILEGWCVGLESQTSSALIEPVNQLEQVDDSSGIWRQYVNDVLSIDYARVFSAIDYLVMLKAPSFDQVYAWRCEQEHKLRELIKQNSKLEASSTPPVALMSDSEIYQFIQYYQRLTEHSLKTMPAKCDVVFTLDAKRAIQSGRYK